MSCESVPNFARIDVRKALCSTSPRTMTWIRRKTRPTAHGIHFAPRVARDSLRDRRRPRHGPHILGRDVNDDALPSGSAFPQVRAPWLRSRDNARFVVAVLLVTRAALEAMPNLDIGNTCDSCTQPLPPARLAFHRERPRSAYENGGCRRPRRRSRPAGRKSR